MYLWLVIIQQQRMEDSMVSLDLPSSCLASHTCKTRNTNPKTDTNTLAFPSHTTPA